MPPSYGQFNVGCFVSLKLFEFGLSVVLSFVDANVGCANVKVSCLVILKLGCRMAEWKFDVDGWYLLSS